MENISQSNRQSFVCKNRKLSLVVRGTKTSNYHLVYSFEKKRARQLFFPTNKQTTYPIRVIGEPFILNLSRSQLLLAKTIKTKKQSDIHFYPQKIGEGESYMVFWLGGAIHNLRQLNFEDFTPHYICMTVVIP